MIENVEMSQTGYAIRMQTEDGAAYWQTGNESSKDQEPSLDIGEPLVMSPDHFQLGTAIVVMEPDQPVTDADGAGLVGDAGMSGPAPYRCPTCDQWRDKWRATVMEMGVDPRRRAPIVGEMYLRRSTNMDERPRWVVRISEAYQMGRTWVEYSERAGVTNEREVGRERVELHTWEDWVRGGGELIGWKNPDNTQPHAGEEAK